MVCAAFYFKSFYEVVGLGLLMDSIFGSVAIFDNFSYFFTLVFLVSVFLINKVREKLIMY
ncbi:MAG: hypothetical protein WC087_03135 [Candidatus Paceibacterota bacterium]